ncbi:MAG: nodulation protein NodZ [Saprospiraceae bacterium]
METKYVVTKRSAGLGDLLVSLWSAWWYAKHTNRQLVVDWRNSTYDKSNQLNLLDDILETPQEIDGVQLNGDLSKLSSLIPHQFYPLFWNSENLHMGAWEMPQLRKDQEDLVKNCRDKSQQVVIFSECLANLIPKPKQEKRFFKQLTFKSKWVQVANDFADIKFENKPVIGLHVRHGNGENIMGHTPYWEEVNQSLSFCCQLLEKCKTLYAKKPYVIYLATDSVVVEQEILSLFPETIVYPKQHRKPGSGALHRENNDPKALQNSLIEMLLLAKSELLIRFPPGSFFTHYASIVKPNSNRYSAELERFCEPRLRPKVVF